MFTNLVRFNHDTELYKPAQSNRKMQLKYNGIPDILYYLFSD